MNTCDIIAKKRDGARLEPDEIQRLISGYASDVIPDYQMSAFLMAAYIRGLDFEETLSLTKAIAESGTCLDLSGIEGPLVDKHSTGGVGDKVTLVVAPWVAATGVRIAKLSGRALGHTGGTLDKLESIPGFSLDLSNKQFIDQVERIGLAIASQTGDICPADKKLYALRDVTATVGSTPLVASSIMGKKIASGVPAIVLDVKTGKGSFTPTLDEARELAQLMVKLGKEASRKVVAVVTDMSQPLGLTVGNSLEVEEAIDCLKGFGSADLMEVCITIAANMLVLSGAAPDFQTAVDRLTGTLDSGQALAKLRELIEAQGGDPEVVHDPRRRLPHARFIEDMSIGRAGYVSQIDARVVGQAGLVLGIGRQTKESVPDLSAGFLFTAKIGDFVEAGNPICQIHANDLRKLTQAKNMLDSAIVVSETEPEQPDIIVETIS